MVYTDILSGIIGFLYNQAAWFCLSEKVSLSQWRSHWPLLLEQPFQLPETFSLHPLHTGWLHPQSCCCRRTGRYSGHNHHLVGMQAGSVPLGIQRGSNLPLVPVASVVLLSPGEFL